MPEFLDHMCAYAMASLFIGGSTGDADGSNAVSAVAAAVAAVAASVNLFSESTIAMKLEQC